MSKGIYSLKYFDTVQYSFTNTTLTAPNITVNLDLLVQ